jgi:hypothetical protein
MSASALTNNNTDAQNALQTALLKQLTHLNHPKHSLPLPVTARKIITHHYRNAYPTLSKTISVKSTLLPVAN